MSWHDVFIYRRGDYEEVVVTHEHPEPATDCELTLYLGREGNWTALEDLGPGIYRARMVDGELEVMPHQDIEVIDVSTS